jgi:AcrR family transcriptional regulator
VSGVVTARSSRVTEKRRRRRGQILHAALDAVREHGYHATTLEQIAARLGVAKTALYHYFPDKEAILYACHRESLAELERLTAEVQRADVRPAERLAALIREHVRVMTETLEGSTLAFEVTALGPARQAEIIAGRDSYEAALRGIVADGVRRGDFRAVDPKITAFAILGAVNWIARWYRPDGALPPAELGRRFADHLVRGLLCP